MDTWEELTVRKGDVELDITSTPGRHGPPVIEKALPPVMGGKLDFRPRRANPSSGCSSREIQSCTMTSQRSPNAIPISTSRSYTWGAKILGVLLTMDAEQGVEAVELFDADTSIPIHYNDYEVFQSPLSDFKEAVTEAGLDGQVAYVDYGDTFRFEVPEARR